MVAALAGASVFLLSGALAAGAATPCAGSVLAGSNFEIDTNANLKVDGPADCIDWLADGSGSAMRAGVITKNDLPTGATDNSFGQGSQENDINPTVVTGSIPPNKSDLKTFGLYAEGATAPQFLELFWSRVQNPSGTTNMDFELNQKFCDPSATPTNCSTNGVTPVRTTGDKLITYDLANGGTVATISIRTWLGVGVWGPSTDLTAAGEALGTVNTTAIAATDSGGLGALSSFTFGEASISIAALFPNLGDLQCGTLGSAFVKSRSSDSFQSEIKDFIAPQSVTISNCATPTLTTTASGPVTVGQTIHDVAHLSGGTNPTGSITFQVFAPGDTTCQTPIAVPPAKTVSGNADYTSGDYTTSQAGDYRWRAFYSGDAHNNAVSTPCNDANESSTVNKAPTSTATELHNNANEAVIALSSSVALGTNVHDKATVSDSVAGVDPTGDVTLPAGDYAFRAHYNGDSNFDASTSSCEPFHVNTAASSTATELHNNANETVIALSSSVALGTNVHDKATVSEGNAAFDPTGDVTFTFFTNNSCDGVGVGAGRRLRLPGALQRRLELRRVDQLV